jgi:hypothetical protein
VSTLLLLALFQLLHHYFFQIFPKLFQVNEFFSNFSSSQTSNLPHQLLINIPELLVVYRSLSNKSQSFFNFECPMLGGSAVKVLAVWGWLEASQYRRGL